MTVDRRYLSAAARKRPRRRRPLRRMRLGWRMRLSLTAIAAVLALFAWAALARRFAPTSNTALRRFDAIIVLGSPTDAGGNPTPAQLARVTEAVHEYERGVAPRLILTGGAVANRFVEARTMARTAEAQGIPAPAIFVEPQARDTIENACYAERIMKTHGWRSAEVVSGAGDLPRAGLIFSRLPLAWRLHAAPSLQPKPAVDAGAAAMLETLKTLRYLLWARRRERCIP